MLWWAQLLQIWQETLTRSLSCLCSSCKIFFFSYSYRSLIIFSSLTRFINARYLIKVKHLNRMMVNSFNMLIGFLIISFACTYNTYKASFFLSLVASVILGTVSAFGESTTLGFCKGFPSTVVGYFGSGTGFAGVFGSGIILLLKSADVSNGTIFFSITPSVVPYFLAFWWVNRMKAKYPYVMEVPAL
jgi:battenin